MLTIHFGQCGNQLGDELFAKITRDIESRNSGVSFSANYAYSETSCERWFSGITRDGRRTARAILVDTERKVIDKICGRDAFSWRYSPKNRIYQSTGGGAANNWAYGYGGKSRELAAEIVEAVRGEAERADRLDGFLGILGCAGGTGSGVGSRSLELLRDEYPTKTLLANVVLPFAGGEVGTQNYNGLLTLAKLSDTCDAMILMENDQLLRISRSVGGHQQQQQQRRRGYCDSRSLRDMNDVACEKLAAVFQPLRDEVRNEANHFAMKMAPHPGYKMATVKCTAPLRVASELGTSVIRTPEAGSFRWHVHVRQLKHTLRISGGSSNHEVTTTSVAAESSSAGRAESAHRAYRRSIATLLITRGHSINREAKEAPHRADDDPISWELLADDALRASWVSRDNGLAHLHQKRRLLEREKFATLVTNNSQICEPLDALVNRAWVCYTNAAFLHRYKEHGLEDDDFLRAFAKVENVVKMYGELDGGS